jgi:hypothetical protein
VFQRDGCLYRQVNASYRDQYRRLLDSGLYDDLVKNGLLVPHEEVETEPCRRDVSFKVIQPGVVPFISYPYEWCFSQMKEAALLTLEVQRRALQRGMSLKDCSAYNVQFSGARPVFIDTLSFDAYEEGRPWTGYPQFCRHFLAPLALMSRRDVRLGKLLMEFIDGIPLDLASRLLPLRSKCGLSLLSHICLHSRSLKYFGRRSKVVKSRILSRKAFLGLLENLRATVESLTWKSPDGAWSGYYADTNYTSEALAQKKEIVESCLERLNPGTVWDLGANEGVFSRLCSRRGIRTIALDSEHAVVERNYLRCVAERDSNILPLVIDLVHPSPGVGWHNRERMTLLDRGPADAVLALALIHHLVFSNHLPLERCAEFFQEAALSLVIEFVPKGDSQAQRLVRMKDGIAHRYTAEAFEEAFRQYFAILGSFRIRDSERMIYLMVRRRSGK